MSKSEAVRLTGAEVWHCDGVVDDYEPPESIRQFIDLLPEVEIKNYP